MKEPLNLLCPKVMEFILAKYNFEVLLLEYFHFLLLYLSPVLWTGSILYRLLHYIYLLHQSQRSTFENEFYMQSDFKKADLNSQKNAEYWILLIRRADNRLTTSKQYTRKYIYNLLLKFKTLLNFFKVIFQHDICAFTQV